MQTFLANLKMWQKFALVVLMIIPMVAVPTALVIRADLDTLGTVHSEQAGLQPAAEIIGLMRLTQQHRGLAAAMLAGNRAMSAQRQTKQLEVTAAMDKLVGYFAARADQHLRNDAAKLREDWQALADAVSAGSLSGPESLARHTALISGELTALDDVGAASQLALDPETASYYLVTAVTMHLPRMTEGLGLARARGVAALTKGSDSPADRAAIGALADRVTMHYADARAALARAADADTSLHTALEKNIAGAVADAQMALNLIQDKVVLAEKFDYDPQQYFAVLTTAIDQQFVLIDTATQALAGILNAREKANERELLVIAALMAVLGVLAIGTIVAVSRAMSRSVVGALNLAEGLAHGDLTRTQESDSSDEIGQVVHGIRVSMAALARIVVDIKESSALVSSAAAQIAAGNLDLSGRTEEQASSLEQTAASMEELSSTVRQSADSAREVNQLAQATSQAASRGGAVVGQVVSTMDDITASSRKIGEIISVIDSIAFQTNILALNAAVEAARAGDQGRGFAVVASEVRTLAQRSAQAAREIKGLINDSMGKVETGSHQVRDAGEAMNEIVAQVSHVTRLIADMTRASAEQSSGIAQVNDAVAQMDQVTQQNAALVEQSAAAAASLKDQADHLAESVALFKVRTAAVAAR